MLTLLVVWDNSHNVLNMNDFHNIYEFLCGILNVVDTYMCNDMCSMKEKLQQDFKNQVIPMHKIICMGENENYIRLANNLFVNQNNYSMERNLYTNWCIIV